MKRITCYVRRNRVDHNMVNKTAHLKIFPWLMETYPDYKNRNKVLHRRDFECRSMEEAESIAKAIYGESAEIITDCPFISNED